MKKLVDEGEFVTYRGRGGYEDGFSYLNSYDVVIIVKGMESFCWRQVDDLNFKNDLNGVRKWKMY